MPLMTQTQFAKSHGMGLHAVGQWRRNGHLVTQGKLVDSGPSDAKLRALNLGRFGARSESPGAAVEEARADLPALQRPLVKTTQEQEDRAVLAAAALGLAAVKSPLPVNHHAGNAGLFQLRDESGMVLEGYGFECAPSDIIKICQDLAKADPRLVQKRDLAYLLS